MSTAWCCLPRILAYSWPPPQDSRRIALVGSFSPIRRIQPTGRLERGGSEGVAVAGLCLLLLLLAMPARGQAAASGTACPPGRLDIEYLEERTTAVFALPAQECVSTQELGRVRVDLQLRRAPLAFGIERSAVTSHCDPFRICEVRLALDHPPFEAGVTYEADAGARSTGPGPHRVLGAAAWRR